MSGLDPRHLRLLEAVLFASDQPLAERTLADRLPDGADLKALLEELKGHYAERGVNLVKAGKTWAFRTATDLASQLNIQTEVTRKLGRAAVETLAIIAYHQPLTRGEIEEIRGVGLSSGTLDVVLEAGWIKPRGRRRTPGRPMTWGTTDAFLDHFGLEDIKDLPGISDLKATGLLDSRPAIDAFRAHAGTDEASDEPAEEEDSETGADQPEPLNPDSGA